MFPIKVLLIICKYLNSDKECQELLNTFQKKDKTDIHVKILKIGGLTICGQSIAGCRTCLAIPELDLFFDIGFCSDIATQQRYDLITHGKIRIVPILILTLDINTVRVNIYGHPDHIGALHLHVFNRRLQSMKKPIYYMPKECVQGFHMAHRAYKSLNRNVDPNIEHEWMLKHYDVFVKEEMKIGRYLIKALQTIHGIPSQGYVIIENRMKLKPQYTHLLGLEIGKLKKSGVEINNITNFCLIAFSGDTTIEGVLNNREFLEVETLIIECTYINTKDIGKDSPAEAKKRGHIHEQDLIDNSKKFLNKNIVLTHLSKRYSKEDKETALIRFKKLFPEKNIYIF